MKSQIPLGWGRKGVCNLNFHPPSELGFVKKQCLTNQNYKAVLSLVTYSPLAPPNPPSSLSTLLGTPEVKFYGTVAEGFLPSLWVCDWGLPMEGLGRRSEGRREVVEFALPASLPVGGCVPLPNRQAHAAAFPTSKPGSLPMAY